ncbi:MAG: chaperone modulator CbpM [Isosphaeraceae bacterium]|nr:chaperone modulator CbpM [Isosphaeraceae bacterium]
MSQPIYSREEVASRLAVSPQLLLRYEQRGLIRSVTIDGATGYDPPEIRRIWRVVTYQRDLGVNLAGVEAILRLRERIEELHHHFHQFSLDLRAAVDERERLESLLGRDSAEAESEDPR